jgi:putative chitinase
VTVQITTKLIRQLVPKIGLAAAEAWATGLNAAMPHAGIGTRREVNHWLAQLAHESAGFSDFEEDLSYSAQRLTAVWPKRFPTIEAAQPFARNGKALANRVYNDRMGNRLGSDDGWYFRGRGPKQLTGRNNYTAFQKWLDSKRLPYDVMRNPDLLTTPTVGALSAAWFWSANHLSAVVRAWTNDKQACTVLTQKINGGTIGLDGRLAWLDRVDGLEA